jgi:hypothetical protein
VLLSLLRLGDRLLLLLVNDTVVREMGLLLRDKSLALDVVVRLKGMPPRLTLRMGLVVHVEARVELDPGGEPAGDLVLMGRLGELVEIVLAKLLEIVTDEDRDPDVTLLIVDELLEPEDGDRLSPAAGDAED